MLSKKQKEEIVNELTDKLKRQKALVFTDFRGLKVEEIQDLRSQLREAGIEHKVAKKTLIKLALEKAKKEVDVNQFESSVALTFGFGDPIMPAKIIGKFAKEHENLKILGGLMGDKFLTLEEVKELAMILSKDELLIKLIGSLQAPVSRLINVFQGNIFNFVNILKQINE